MTARIFPADAVAGAPTYTGRALRQTAVAPFVAMGSSARPLGAKSGIRVGTPSSIVSVTSTTWTVTPFAGVIDGEAAAIAGPYTYSFDTNQTGSVTPAGASARVDRLDVQVSDPAESDGSSTPSIQCVYTAGTPGLAAAPDRSHAFVQFNVPATGGGSPTVSWAPSWSGDLGEWTFNTFAEMTAYTTAIGSANVPPQQDATVLSDTVNTGSYRWNGSAWTCHRPAVMARSATATTIPAGYTNLSLSSLWTNVQTPASFAAYNNGWTIPWSGMWEVVVGIRADGGLDFGFTVNKTASVGAADIHAFTSAALVGGVAVGQGVKKLPLNAGDVLTAFGAPTGTVNWSTDTNSSQFSIQYIG